MVRFVPFVVASVILGVTAGAHVPSSKGEKILMSAPPRRKELTVLHAYSIVSPRIRDAVICGK